MNTTTGMSGVSTGLSTIRVILLTEHQVLLNYGPVLRRLAVGLIDEVGDLSIFSEDNSVLLEHLPCPPVRIIRQSRRVDEQSLNVTDTSRDVVISSPKIKLLERLWTYRQAERLADTLATFKPTLLHAMSEHQGHLARNLSRILEIPYVVSLLSMHRIDLSILHDENCRKIMPCSLNFTRKLRQRRPELINRLNAVPIGTHVTEESHVFLDEGVLPQLICCGPLEQGLGYVELLNAVKRLFEKGYRFHLTLAGDGPAESELRRQTRMSGVNDYVHFVPPIEAMVPESDAYKAVMKRMDIFIQPWPERTWHPALLEAMSVGTAVVTTQGIINDLIVNEQTALSVPFHDEQALTEALEKLLADREFARELGRQGQEFLRKHFLASRMVTRLSRAYRQAIDSVNALKS